MGLTGVSRFWLLISVSLVGMSVYLQQLWILCTSAGPENRAGVSHWRSRPPVLRWQIHLLPAPAVYTYHHFIRGMYAPVLFHAVHALCFTRWGLKCDVENVLEHIGKRQLTHNLARELDEKDSNHKHSRTFRLRFYQWNKYDISSYCPLMKILVKTFVCLCDSFPSHQTPRSCSARSSFTLWVRQH